MSSSGSDSEDACEAVATLTGDPGTARTARRGGPRDPPEFADDGARNLTGGMTSHTIGDDPQPKLRTT